MQTAQQQPIPGPEIDLALDRATQELNTSYVDLCERVERLTQELHQSRTQLVRELAEKEVIFQTPICTRAGAARRHAVG